MSALSGLGGGPGKHKVESHRRCYRNLTKLGGHLPWGLCEVFLEYGEDLLSGSAATSGARIGDMISHSYSDKLTGTVEKLRKIRP